MWQLILAALLTYSAIASVLAITLIILGRRIVGLELRVIAAVCVIAGIWPLMLAATMYERVWIDRRMMGARGRKRDRVSGVLE